MSERYASQIARLQSLVDQNARLPLSDVNAVMADCDEAAIAEVIYRLSQAGIRVTDGAVTVSAAMPPNLAEALEVGEMVEIQEETPQSDVTGVAPQPTHKPIDLLKLYLREIGAIDLLTDREIKDLAGRAAQGDRAARDRLIETHLRLTVAIAKQYTGQGLPLTDLIQEGSIGLITAAMEFTEPQSLSFPNYAALRIRLAISHALAEQSFAVKLPAYLADGIRAMKKASEQLELTLGREPDAQELAQAMQEEPERITALLLLAKDAESIDKQTTPASDAAPEETLADALEAHDDCDNEECDCHDHHHEENRVMERVMGMLTQQERELIDMRFGLTRGEAFSQAETAKRMGISLADVEKLETETLEKLRTKKEELLG